jgi:glycosyltransferase involved in cell wall biosynthesis
MNNGIIEQPKRKCVIQCIASLKGGGAERQIVILSNELAKTGWVVHLVVLELGENLADLDQERVILHQLSAKSNYDMRIVTRIRRIILDNDADIVQTWLPLMDVAGGFASVLTRRPWVLSERTSSQAYLSFSFRTFLRKIIGRFANVVVANSRGGLDYWSGVRAGNSKRYVVPNAVPFNRINDAQKIDRESFLESTETQLVVYVGRLIESKNIRNLLFAFSRVVAQNNAVLVLCGDGPQRTELEALAKELKISDAVRFLGYVNNIYSWMKSADALVMPSRYEGMPNSVIEAAAAGCRIALSDIKAHREILTPEAACFFNCDDVNGMADAINETLKDVPSNVAMSKKARDDVSMLGACEVAGKYDRILMDSIKNS